MILRIFVKPESGEGEPVPLLFPVHLAGRRRSEANAIKALLSKSLTEIRNNDPAVPRPISQPAAEEASADASAGRSARYFDDGQLLADGEVQKSLMKKDRNLAQIYMTALQSKPNQFLTMCSWPSSGPRGSTCSGLTPSRPTRRRGPTMSCPPSSRAP